MAATLMENDKDLFLCRRSNSLIESLQQHFVVAAGIPLALSPKVSRALVGLNLERGLAPIVGSPDYIDAMPLKLTRHRFI